MNPKRKLKRDLTGQIYGDLTILKKYGDFGHWLAKCSCGKFKIVSATSVHHGTTTNCGCKQPPPKSKKPTNGDLHKNVKDLRGNVYGRLTVTDYAGSRGDSTKCMHARWKATCICGNITEVFGYALHAGTVKSCGCLKREIARKACKERLGSRKDQESSHNMTLEKPN